MERRRLWRVLVSGAVLSSMIAVVGPASAQNPVDKGGPSATFGACKKSYASGTGNSRFEWCFTTLGSVNNLKHPVNTSQMSTFDGFCLSADDATNLPVRYSTTESVQAPTYPSVSSVQRRTSDNKFVITESFAQTTASKTVTVTMKVQNVSGVPQFLALTRVADFDAGGSSLNNSWVQTGTAVQATYPGLTTAILRGTTPNSSVSTMTIPYVNGDLASILGVGCYDESTDNAIGPVNGDRIAGIQYLFGLVNNNATKTVKFTYQVLF